MDGPSGEVGTFHMDQRADDAHSNNNKKKPQNNKIRLRAYSFTSGSVRLYRHSSALR